MKRFLGVLLSLVLVATACGEDGPVNDAMEAVGLSQNVDVQAPPPEPTIDDVLGQLAASGFNGIVLVDTPAGLRVAPMGTVDGPASSAVDENTVFDIGSITKQFTAAGILRLEMDGLLSVDDRLGDLLPEVDGPLADRTLHELLTHTAGLPDAIGDDYERLDRPAFIDRAEERVGEPGDHRYSNTGYSLLGMVIETVSSVGYEAYLRSVFFDPAGMDSTGYVQPDFDSDQVAVGYVDGQRRDAPNELPWADDGPWWNLRANGGILSTAADMRRWHEALSGDGLLDSDAKAKLFDRHVEEGPDAGTYYGYGWVSFPTSDGRWFHGHNGGNGIFFADMLRFTDDVFIFLATNHAGADDTAAFRIADVVIDAGVDLGCLPPMDLDGFQQFDGFPETDAAEAAEALTNVLLDADDVERRAFAEARVSDELADGASLDEQVEVLADLQQEFVGYTVRMVHVEDGLRTHVTLATPDKGQLVLSVHVDETDPTRITCVQIAEQ